MMFLQLGNRFGLASYPGLLNFFQRTREKFSRALKKIEKAWKLRRPGYEARFGLQCSRNCVTLIHCKLD